MDVRKQSSPVSLNDLVPITSLREYYLVRLRNVSMSLDRKDNVVSENEANNEANKAQKQSYSKHLKRASDWWSFLFSEFTTSHLVNGNIKENEPLPIFNYNSINHLYKISTPLKLVLPESIFSLLEREDQEKEFFILAMHCNQLDSLVKYILDVRLKSLISTKFKNFKNSDTDNSLLKLLLPQQFNSLKENVAIEPWLPLSDGQKSFDVALTEAVLHNEKMMKMVDRTIKVYQIIQKTRNLSIQLAACMSKESFVAVAVDLEVFEFNHDVILEIGFTRYVKKPGIPYSLSAYHYVIATTNPNISNKRYVPDRRGRFHFGTSKVVTRKTGLAALQAALSDADVVIGHAADAEERYLTGTNVKWKTGSTSGPLMADTQLLAQSILKMSPIPGLSRLLTELGCTSYRDLHNAGNDAYWTLASYLCLMHPEAGWKERLNSSWVTGEEKGPWSLQDDVPYKARSLYLTSDPNDDGVSWSKKSRVKS